MASYRWTGANGTVRNDMTNWLKLVVASWLPATEAPGSGDDVFFDPAFLTGGANDPEWSSEETTYQNVTFNDWAGHNGSLSNSVFIINMLTLNGNFGAISDPVPVYDTTAIVIGVTGNGELDFYNSPASDGTWSGISSAGVCQIIDSTFNAYSIGTTGAGSLLIGGNSYVRLAGVNGAVTLDAGQFTVWGAQSGNFTTCTANAGATVTVETGAKIAGGTYNCPILMTGGTITGGTFRASIDMSAVTAIGSGGGALDLGGCNLIASGIACTITKGANALTDSAATRYTRVKVGVTNGSFVFSGWTQVGATLPGWQKNPTVIPGAGFGLGFD